MTCLMMLVVVLTGCSAFKVDKVKYYNEILAKVGNDNITRLELINAYNSYGYQTYVTQQGKSEKEALLSTMDLLVQRKLVVKHAMDNSDKYALSNYEINQVYRKTIDGLMDSIDGNIETARKIYNLELDEQSKQEEEGSKELFKLSEYNYEKRVEIVDGQIKYISKDLNQEDFEPVIDMNYINDFSSYTQNQIVEQLFEKFKSELKTNKNNEDEELYTKVCNKALELTANNLLNYEYYMRENGKKLSTNQEDLLFRYVQRTYESELESAYITKVNTVYLENETLSNESVINAYKAMYESDFAKYVNDSDDYNEKIIKTDSDLIYYTPNSDAEFGYFLHVLLPLNNVEDDLKWLKEHRHLYTDEQYQAEQMNLINQIMCAQRTTNEVRDDESGELLYEEGVTLDEQVSIIDVLQQYEQNVRDLQSFKEFMFRYTTDNATLTADMPYIIGYDVNEYTGEIKDDKVVGAYSSMVNNFTNEAIRLMKQNKSYTNANEYILTNYGVHLLYYIEPVTNKIAPSDLDKLTIEKLDSTLLNKATGETYLDRVFDLVYPANSDGMFTTNTKYSSYEENLTNSLYSVYPVKLYKTRIKASNKI